MQAVHFDVAERISNIRRGVVVEELGQVADLLWHWTGFLAVVSADDEKVRNGLSEAETDIDDISGQARQRRHEEILKRVLVRRRADELSQAANKPDL
jgi:hypothetical protein